MPAANPHDSTDIRGEDLKSLRVARRITISEVARRCDVSKQSVWLLERPGHFVTVGAAERYLAALTEAVESRAHRTRDLLAGPTPPDAATSTEPVK